MIPRADATLLERLPAAIFWLLAGVVSAFLLFAPAFFLARFLLGP